MHCTDVPVQAAGHVHEDGRPYGHQRVGAKSGGALANLSLEADRPSEDEGCEETAQGLGEGVGLQEFGSVVHVGILGRGAACCIRIPRAPEGRRSKPALGRGYTLGRGRIGNPR